MNEQIVNKSSDISVGANIVRPYKTNLHSTFTGEQCSPLQIEATSRVINIRKD